MNKMYEYLKNHAYISYNKKSNYEFELSEERAKCIANKYDSLTEKLQQENKQLKEKLDCDLQWALKYEKQVGNWNKLKWYIMKKDCHNETFTYLELIEKMKELERSVSNVED